MQIIILKIGRAYEWSAVNSGLLRARGYARTRKEAQADSSFWLSLNP